MFDVLIPARTRARTLAVASLCCVEWTHDNMNVRLRQAHTATGWYASLETSVESDN